jgi:hypothetical protein
MVVGLAAGAVLLAGCGGGGGKSNANASTAPSSAPSAAPSDSGSAAPTDGAQPSDAPSGGAGYTGPTVGPGHKCGTVTVVTGSIQCSHAEKIYELYAQNKKPDGKAIFNGWTCTKEVVGVICSRSGIRLRSA